MSEVIEQLNEFEAKALELLEQIQEPIVDGVRSAVEWADEKLPEAIKVPNLDRLGTVDEYVDFAFKAVDASRLNVKSRVSCLVAVNPKLCEGLPKLVDLPGSISPALFFKFGLPVGIEVPAKMVKCQSS